MSYAVWKQIVATTPDALAFWDMRQQKRWSFAQLAAEAEAAPPLPEGVVFAPNGGVDFVLTVLRAWRQRLPLCPFDHGPPANVPSVDFLAQRGIVHLKMTSGSTGEPRLVMFRATQLAADCENILTTMGLRREWPNLGVISLAHSYGFSNLVLPLLLHGIPLIMLGDALPASLHKALAQVGPCTLPAVPALWRTWRDAGVLSENIRLGISAGAPLSIELEASIFQTCGLKVHNFYGSSECGGIAYDRTDTPRPCHAPLGTPMDQVVVSVEEDGCLAVSSAAVGEGYWPATDNDALRGRKFYTTDLARFENGQIWLVGRKTDTINVAGRKANPSEIEMVLQQIPGVAHACVFGTPSADVERHEEIAAIICLTESGATTAEALRRAVAARLPSWQIPRHWWLNQDLKPNIRGKISRQEWRERWKTHHSRPSKT